jgi:hypothetical protein
MNRKTKIKLVEEKLDGKVILTENEIKLCKSAVYRTYSVIASDAGLPEDAPFYQVLEVVLDADYVRSYGEIPDQLYDKFKTWVRQELDKDGSWKQKYTRIGKVIW